MGLKQISSKLFIVFKKRPNTENSRHAHRAFQTKHFSSSTLILWLTIVFLFLPLIVITFYSFNAGKGSRFTGFSLVWYQKLFSHESSELWSALANSLFIALVSALVSTVLGSLAAIGTAWYSFKGKSYIRLVSFLPMVLPEVIVGASSRIFFSAGHLPFGMLTIALAHITFCLPFVFLIVQASVSEFDFSIVEASRDLGATERQTMFRVVIPAVSPGILSGFMMAVTMSLEDYVITFFATGPGATTLPLYVYSMIRFGVSPVIDALSVALILATFIIAISLRRFLKAFAAAK
ncbi:MAG: ABC transporter permease [Treponemataceae bacterium]|nr:MAG: ABC transporter permease [Treponemataceae bacterium]